MMPDAFLDALSVHTRAARWKKHLAEGLGADRRLHVALDREAIVGMAGVGPDRASLGCGELYMINVDPAAWGKGIGRALLEHATAALKDLGHTRAILWVVTKNDRARRMYEKAGWAHDGTVQDNEIAEGGISFKCSEARYGLASLGDQDRPAM